MPIPVIAALAAAAVAAPTVAEATGQTIPQLAGGAVRGAGKALGKVGQAVGSAFRRDPAAPDPDPGPPPSPQTPGVPGVIAALGSPSGDDLTPLTVPKSFDQSQLEAADIIRRVFAAAPLPPSLAGARDALTRAALVNAWAESNWRNKALNDDGEFSVGLFQANRQGGAGQGFSKEQLENPVFNSLVILREVWRAESELAPIARRGTVSDLVAAFTVYVEKPANKEAKGRQRADLARRWLGSPAVDRPAWG